MDPDLVGFASSERGSFRWRGVQRGLLALPRRRGRDSIAHWGLGRGNRERVNACVIPAGTYILGVRVLHARKSERAGESASYIASRLSRAY